MVIGMGDMGRAAGDIILNAEQQALFEQMSALIDRLDDGIALMNTTQDMVASLLRRGCDAPLREQTLGEISRFFLGIIKADNLSDQYKMNRLRMFARATVRIMLNKRPAVAAEVVSPPPGEARRATDALASILCNP